jgi:hypothetical protein
MQWRSFDMLFSGTKKARHKAGLSVFWQRGRGVPIQMQVKIGRFPPAA